MIVGPRSTLVLAVLTGSIHCLSLSALGQVGPAGQTSPSAQKAARDRILQSEKWRHAQRAWDEWLSVQQIYTSDEIAAMREEMSARVAEMSPHELENFMKDMDGRLEVLLSPEAKEARQWLGQFRSAVRDPEAILGRPLPDVANMSASQIREEIQWLQQHREARQQAQATSLSARQLQLQTAQGIQASRQQAMQQTQNRSNWPSNNPVRRSPYAPQRRPVPLPPDNPVISISPWGTPIQWHPLGIDW